MRWARRPPVDFPRGTKDFAKRHLEAVENRVPKLANRLERARAQWEQQFWDNAPAQKADGDVALTAAEIATIRQAIKQMTPDQYSTALYSDLEMLVESGFASAKQLLHLKVDLKDVKPSFAMDALRKHVEDFTFLVNEREQQALNDTLDQALSEGWTPGKLGKEIAQTFAGGYHITNDSGQIVRTIPTDTWSDTVARTELARAQVMGQMALYDAAKAEKVIYVTTQGGSVCDLCSPYDGEVFDINDAPEVPQHPNCCCAYTPADLDLAYNPEDDR